MKTVKETKLKAVKEHLDDGLTIKEVCEKYKINPAVLKFLTALYRRHGEEPFLRHREGKQTFTREQKLEMIKRHLMMVGQSYLEMSATPGPPEHIPE